MISRDTFCTAVKSLVERRHKRIESELYMEDLLGLEKSLFYKGYFELEKAVLPVLREVMKDEQDIIANWVYENIARQEDGSFIASIRLHCGNTADMRIVDESDLYDFVLLAAAQQCDCDHSQPPRKHLCEKLGIKC